MGYEPYPNNGRGEIWGNRDATPSRNYGYGYDPDRDRGRSSAREFAAADRMRDDDGYRGGWQRDDRPRGRYGRDDEHRRYDSERGRYADRHSRGPQERRPDGYDHDDRDFFSRAGDEVRSWFGDEDAERRRAMDARYDAREEHARDSDYHGWRRRQIDALDRDYAEYRRENAARFDNEFGAWRTERQGQRTSLQRVTEHMEVIGSDGAHIGTVDKVRGDRIILTKSDPDAGGHHHSIPSRWIESVEDSVRVRKTADEAKAAWRDEERSGAMFGDRNEQDGPHYLNRSFSGTY